MGRLPVLDDESLLRKLARATLPPREWIPRLKRLAVEHDLESPGIGGIAREEAMEHHREVLRNRLAHRLESSDGVLTVGPRVREDPIELLPDNNRTRGSADG